jgi:peroxiredoxin
MKKTILLSFITLLLFSCNKYEINGSVTGINDGTKVILYTQNEMGGPQPIDTSEVKDGKFEFNGKSELPEIAQVSFDKQNIGYLPFFILEKGTIEVTIDTKKLENTKIEGTPNNDLYNQYNQANKDIFEKAKKINEENAAILSKAPTNDEEKAKGQAVVDQFMKLQEEMNTRSLKFIKANPNTFVSVLLTENLYFKGKMTDDEAKKVIDGLDANLQKTRNAKSISDMIKMNASKKKKTTDKSAPDFKAKTPEGKTVSLKESLGKVTIIDFWASWCGPCRKENPNVVALYAELHTKGLNIIGVSLDEDASKWKEAIAKDQLTWTQVSNLKGWKDPIATLYNVEQIPTTFILDEKGVIVAKDLRGEELKAKVKELLGVK